MAYAASQLSPSLAGGRHRVYGSSLITLTKLLCVGVALTLTVSLAFGATAGCTTDIFAGSSDGGVGTDILHTETGLDEDEFLVDSVEDTGEDSDGALDPAVQFRDAGWGLSNLQLVLASLRKEKHAAGGADRGEITRDTMRGGGASHRLHEVHHFLNRAGLTVDSNYPGCPGAYVQKVLESFYRPLSLLEPGGLRAFFDFHISVIENANGWLAHKSKYYQKSIQQKLVDGLDLARVFVAAYEIVLAEALSVVRHLGTLHKSPRFLEGALHDQSLGIYVSRLLEVSWQMDAVLGEVSSSARAYRCSRICASLACRWTCGVETALAAAADSLAALMTLLASIFETIRGLIETSRHVECFTDGTPSTFEHREATANFEQHASVLSGNVADFQRLVKETGERLLQFHSSMEEFSSLALQRV